ncbi:unnamed protein product [Prunus armeniaca]|uniref:Uncharacterized protein n=1 Tax=Prunus armeniaca TaxID=36596 RepID=A0A6J5XZ52_PRUAR|nr:unnamed protein product [Prunus armeniaca]
MGGAPRRIRVQSSITRQEQLNEICYNVALTLRRSGKLQLIGLLFILFKTGMEWAAGTKCKEGWQGWEEVKPLLERIKEADCVIEGLDKVINILDSVV